MNPQRDELDDDVLPSSQSTAAVRDVYDEIAAHFSKTRAYPWPEVESFLAAQSGQRGLDIGCGNGRHTTLLADRCEQAVGVDVSRSLLDEATEAHPERVAAGSVQYLQADAESLPISNDCIDVAIYIATVHHLPSRDQRVASLRELNRVLGNDGVALVSTWSTVHDRFEGDAESEEGFDTMVDWTLPGGETVPRFYHIYAPMEFQRDIEDAGLRIESFELSSGNCYVTVRPNSLSE